MTPHAQRLKRLWRLTLAPLLTVAGAAALGAPAVGEPLPPQRAERHLSKQRALSKPAPRPTTPTPSAVPRRQTHGKQKAGRKPAGVHRTPAPRAPAAAPVQSAPAARAKPAVKVSIPLQRTPPPSTPAPRATPRPKPAVAHQRVAPAPAVPSAPEPLVIEDLRWHPFGLVLQATRGFEPQVDVLENPHRLVVDLPDADFADTHLKRAIPVETDDVKQVRIGEHAGGLRLVIDCRRAPNFQLMQLRERSVLIIARSGAHDPALGRLLKQFSAVPEPVEELPPGQELKGFWARETDTRLTLHVGLEDSRVSLFQPSPDRLRIRIPGGHFTGKLPAQGRLLQKIEASQEGSTWILDVMLAPGHYEVSERRYAREGLTLVWDRIDPRAQAHMPLVVIDPGHGGNDPGALGMNGRNEKTVCLELGRAVRDALRRRGYNAILTRGVDAEMHLVPRVALIKRWQADMFISLHANSHASKDVQGLETYWREPGSRAFAQMVHQTVTTLLRRPDRGVKQDGLFVLRNGGVPSLLLETGFISNPQEEQLLNDSNFQAQAAFAIATGIDQFRLAPREIGRAVLPVETSWAACTHP